jgi:hypothetical protein
MNPSITIPLAEYESLQRDKARLDFLDRCNTGMNAHCKTLYGWELVRSPNITRIMTRSPFSGELAAVDLNDANAVGTHEGGVLSCRVAIDKGIAQYQRQVDPAEDHAAVSRLVSERLMEWSRSWILDGDVVRCRKCERGIGWCNRGEALNHHAECPQKMAYPWSLLISLQVEDSVRATSPVPA